MTDNQESEPSKDEVARGKIERFHKSLQRQNHFQIFGAAPDTDPDKIKAAYHTLVKQFHADAYAGIDLGPAKETLDEIFSHIQHAYDTITDARARAEYLVLLDRQAKGLSTDVSAILGAEQLFDEALAKLKRRDYAGAAAQLTEARRLNPEDPLMPVHHAWASYNAQRKNEATVAASIDALKKITKKQEDLALAWQYLGQIYFNLDKPAEARNAWKRCLEAEPKNIEASRGLRLLETRKAQSESGFGALMKKIFKRG